MENAVATYTPAGALSVADVKGQVNLIQHIMKEVMKDGDHFGTIPGCGPKPTLLKPGAEKIAMTFRFAVDPQVEIVDLPNYHREYRVRVAITNSAGEFLGAGVGCCSTLEGKFRFRTGPTEITSEVVPKKYWDLKREDPAAAQKIIGGPGYATKKGEDGVWYIAIQGQKCEHDNPADYWNTVLKMAKKRSLVDAILTVTAASDIFTQDIEDDPSLYVKTTQAAPAPVKEEVKKEGAAPDPKKEEPKPEPKRGPGRPAKDKTPDPAQDPAQETKKDTPPAEATPETIQEFWKAFQALADETDEPVNNVVVNLTKGNIDPHFVEAAPVNYILSATKKAQALLSEILGVSQ